MGVGVGIDIGGTFTDFVLIDPVSGRVDRAKHLTTSPDPSEGVMRGLQELLKSSHVAPTEIEAVVHGTTLVANALIERRGARTALITTRGFRDVLEIGREMKHDLYDLNQERSEPLVPRYWRHEVVERVAADGSVVVPLDTLELEKICADLRSQKIESVAVCFVHSYVNGEHERCARERLLQHNPGWSVSISSEVAPEIREYERVSTAVANAYVQPVVDRYLATLEARFEELGITGAFRLMLSSGGIGTPITARERPVWLVESGAAAGAMSSAVHARRASIARILSFDMGGTTAKICTIHDGRPTRTNEIETARRARFRRFSGLPLRLPALELSEIGSGGGSVARVDSMGFIRVGPISAGADPGPACYARGGNRPTVTDADLLLGYLNADHFAGGSMRLDRDAAELALKTHVGDPAGLDATRAAIGVFEIVNDNMATAARMHVIEKGFDPRRYTMVAFGGAGPVHAYELARALRISRIIYPSGAGVASAMGLLVAPMAIDFVQSYLQRIDRLDWARVNSLLDRFEADARATLVQAGAHPSSINCERTADMRYVGQGREISVSLPPGPLQPESETSMAQAFVLKYREHFERDLGAVPVEAVTWRLTAIAASLPFERPQARPTVPQEWKAQGRRMAYFPELRSFVDCPTYTAESASPGARLRGPAIVEQPGCTIVVGPSGTGSIDADLSLEVVLPSIGDPLVEGA